MSALAFVCALALCACALAKDYPACPAGEVPEELVDPRGAPGGMYMQVYAAGRGAEPGARLVDGSAICPGEYGPGFSVLCKGVAPGTSKVSFYAGGRKLRDERKAPYTIHGDNGVFIRAWSGYPKGDTVLKCVSNNGDFAETKVTIGC